MAILPILCYPDPRLHKVAQPVQAVDARIQALVADMLATMYDAHGIGLAATQIDVHERIVVIDVSEERNEPLVLINPEVTWTSAETNTYEEGCLSIPGVPAEVTRPAEITLQWTDLSGAVLEERLTGLAATCAQHELDHLYGRLCIDLMPEAARVAASPALAALAAAGAAGVFRRLSGQRRNGRIMGLRAVAVSGGA